MILRRRIPDGGSHLERAGPPRMIAVAKLPGAHAERPHRQG
jgi:hypothetical protein